MVELEFAVAVNVAICLPPYTGTRQICPSVPLEGRLLA